jgi:anti-sigma regulatory factor (Ser/Thr protein kinase)
VCDVTPDAELRLPLDARAAGLARRFLRECRCGEHHLEVLDEAELVISELVTNGVRHAAPPLTIRVSCPAGDGLQISVTDGSADGPTARDADDLDETGRGMALVDYVSDDWGVDRDENGKTVWVHLSGSPV